MAFCCPRGPTGIRGPRGPAGPDGADTEPGLLQNETAGRVTIDLVDTVIQTAPLVLAQQTTVHYHFSGSVRIINPDPDTNLTVGLWIEVDGVQIPGTFRDLPSLRNGTLTCNVATHGVMQSAAGAHTIDVVAVRTDGDLAGSAQTHASMLTGDVFTIP